MNKISIRLYEESYRSEWDSIVRSSRNGTFLHTRDYIEYHGERFDERSIIIFNGEKPWAVFPATVHGETIISHAGLTFGGLVFGMDVRTSEILSIMEKISEFYREFCAKKIIYKAVPYIFHSYPAQEDLYALFRINAVLVRRDISSAILLSKRPKYSSLRRRSVNKGRKAGLSVMEGEFFPEFHRLLSNVLERHGACPVHSVDELAYLQSKFPDNISLVGAFRNHELLAATWLFKFGSVVHTQYLANSEEGRKVGALDFVIDHVILSATPEIRMVNLGISTEQKGRFLNEGLISQKEGFGGRGVVYDHYEVSL